MVDLCGRYVIKSRDSDNYLKVSKVRDGSYHYVEITTNYVWSDNIEDADIFRYGECAEHVKQFPPNSVQIVQVLRSIL